MKPYSDQDIVKFNGRLVVNVVDDETEKLVITSLEQYNEIEEKVNELVAAKKHYHNPVYYQMQDALEAYYDLMGMED